MLRRIVGVVIGYMVFSISATMLFNVTHSDPRDTASLAFMIGSTLYGMLFAGLGGYLAAVIAGHPETSIALTVIIALGALISIFNRSGEIWSQIGALFFMAPAAALGGRFVKPSAPLVVRKTARRGTYIVNTPEPGYAGARLLLEEGAVDLHNYGEFRGYETPQLDVVTLKWEGSGDGFAIVSADGKSRSRVSRLDWVFEGVSSFSVGPRNPDMPDSEDRTLEEYQVVRLDPETAIRLKFRGGVVIDLAARSTHAVIASK